MNAAFLSEVTGMKKTSTKIGSIKTSILRPKMQKFMLNTIVPVLIVLDTSNLVKLLIEDV